MEKYWLFQKKKKRQWNVFMDKQDKREPDIGYWVWIWFIKSNNHNIENHTCGSYAFMSHVLQAGTAK